MIERFNFYDIYGYLLPGLVLCAVIGLPLWLIAGKLPPTELGSALAAAVLGYIVGQLAHAFARRLFSDQRPFGAEVERLQAEAKERFRKKLVRLVGWEVSLSDSSIFAICRRALQDQDRGQLADQFQGMYALTRGIALAFYTAAAYYAGVCIGGFTIHQQHIDWRWLIPLCAVCSWTYVAFMNHTAKHAARPAPGQLPQTPWYKKIAWRDAERVIAAAVMVLFGVIAGSFVPPHPHRFMAFGISSPLCFMFAIRMHRIFREHDVNVAKTVLTDFLVGN